MLWTILIYSICTGLSALSVGFWDFAFYRFLTGLGVGGEFAVGVALVAEVMPERARPSALGSACRRFRRWATLARRSSTWDWAWSMVRAGSKAWKSTARPSPLARDVRHRHRARPVGNSDSTSPQRARALAERGRARQAANNWDPMRSCSATRAGGATRWSVCAWHSRAWWVCGASVSSASTCSGGCSPTSSKLKA